MSDLPKSGVLRRNSLAGSRYQGNSGKSRRPGTGGGARLSGGMGRLVNAGPSGKSRTPRPDPM